MTGVEGRRDLVKVKVLMREFFISITEFFNPTARLAKAMTDHRQQNEFAIRYFFHVFARFFFVANLIGHTLKRVPACLQILRYTEVYSAVNPDRNQS